PPPPIRATSADMADTMLAEDGCITGSPAPIPLVASGHGWHSMASRRGGPGSGRTAGLGAVHGNADGLQPAGPRHGDDSRSVPLLPPPAERSTGVPGARVRRLPRQPLRRHPRRRASAAPLLEPHGDRADRSASDRPASGGGSARR